MNVRLLRRVKRRILKEPRQFQMHNWFASNLKGSYLKDQHIEMDLPRSTIPNCGTAACIGGWAIALDAQENPKQAARMMKFAIDVASEAGRILEIPQEKRLKLFSIAWWPKQFHYAWFAAKSHAKRAKVAAERIEHFIKTEGAE